MRGQKYFSVMAHLGYKQLDKRQEEGAKEENQKHYHLEFTSKQDVNKLKSNIQNLEIQLTRCRGMNKMANIKINELNQTIQFLQSKLNQNKFSASLDQNSPFFVDSNKQSYKTSKKNSCDGSRVQETTIKAEKIREIYEEQIINIRQQFQEKISILQRQNQQLHKRIIEYQSISKIVQQYKVFETAINKKQEKIRYLMKQNKEIKNKLQFLQVQNEALTEEIKLLYDEKAELGRYIKGCEEQQKLQNSSYVQFKESDVKSQLQLENVSMEDEIQKSTKQKSREIYDQKQEFRDQMQLSRLSKQNINQANFEFQTKSIIYQDLTNLQAQKNSNQSFKKICQKIDTKMKTYKKIESIQLVELFLNKYKICMF